MAETKPINWNNVASKTLAGIEGVTGLASGFMQASRIADTSAQQNIIDRMNNMSQQNYGTFDQLNNAYSYINNLQPDLNLGTIRGMNAGQKAGNILTSAITGASTGLSVGGPWGALGGAIVGLGTGIGGVLAGDNAAESEQRRLQNRLALAQAYSGYKKTSQEEKIADSNYRGEISIASEYGGQIHRRQLTMREFADMTEGKKIPAQKKPIVGVVREMCDGGIRIRIKR